MGHLGGIHTLHLIKLDGEESRFFRAMAFLPFLHRSAVPIERLLIANRTVSFERAPRVEADADAGRVARAVKVRGAADGRAAVAAAALCLCGGALVEGGGLGSAWGGGCCCDGGGEGEGEERFELHFVFGVGSI